MAREWDKANMKSLGVNLKREEAEAFQELARKHGTTVGGMLRMYIQSMLADENPNVDGLSHIVSYKNTDRLKHETSFHNPSNKDPNGVLNEILDRYFAFADEVRK